jgi:hypothetical protein
VGQLARRSPRRRGALCLQEYGYALRVLSVGREDEPERQRGTVLWVHQSVFAPSEDALRFARPGASDPASFRVVYVRRLRELWRRDPGAFLMLIELATGGQDLTLTDDYGDADYAPRRILAAALKQLAKTRRDEARRRARRASSGGRSAPGQRARP